MTLAHNNKSTSGHGTDGQTDRQSATQYAAPSYGGGRRIINYDLTLRMKTVICAKFDADVFNIPKVTSRKTKWPRFFSMQIMILFSISLRPSVRLSVCQSSVVCLKERTHRRTFWRSGRGIILVLWPQRRYKIPRGTASAGALNVRDGN